VDFYFYQTAEVKRRLREAGFELEEVIESLTRISNTKAGGRIFSRGRVSGVSASRPPVEAEPKATNRL
jgi:hypothetical protein